MDSCELARRIRLHAIDMVHHAHASHIGGVLSEADIVAVLYSGILNVYSDDPFNNERDRFILSKGHTGVAVYAALAECGFLPMQLLDTYGDDGSALSCHISHKHVPGVEVSTGSLGHGCCIACGMALHAKQKGKKYKVYTLVGDGECNEGSVWEMAMLASQFNLDNFTVIVDKNEMQAMGFCRDIIDMEPFCQKWIDFGWTVIDVLDGHNHNDLRNAMLAGFNGKPKVIIAHTVKGKGVSFMENELLWHYRDPQGDYYSTAINELKR